MRLSTEIKRFIGRLVRVCIIARYSTAEQSPTSIDAQVLLCKKFLRLWGLKDCEVHVEVISDPECSGEAADRPGIFTLRTRIRERGCDLIIAEDSSRLYRNTGECLRLVGDAVDNGIRVIFPGDDIDTEDENWVGELTEAQGDHTRCNYRTKKRVRRSQEERMDSGAAMGPLKPGYKRRPTTPATAKDPEMGPFFDDIDPQWAPVIREAYERIQRRERPWFVAKWLTEVGLPKTANCHTPVWSAKNVIDLIRRMVYRGVEEFGITVTKKHHGSGKGKPHRQEKKDIKTRPMEHHRIVSDNVWYEANAAIDSRITRPPPPRGLDHPLARIPRDSRGPLSNLFYCGCCGGDSKMYVEGRHEGGYRCKEAKKGHCWNKATALRQLTHQQIGSAIAAELMAGDDFIDSLVGHIARCLESDEPRQHRLREASVTIHDLKQKCDRLAKLLEDGQGDSPILLQLLKVREQELVVANAVFDELKEQDNVQRTLPSREEITARILQVSRELLNLSPEAGMLLRRLLVGKILAVPYQQFGGDKVVLRAEFKINVLGILPGDLDSVLRGTGIKDSFPTEVRTLCIDLFEPSVVPANASAAWGLRKAGVMPKEIAKTLGLSKRQTTQAVKLGREMEEANIQDPYIRLTERPAAASRWKSRRPAPNDGNDAADDAA